MIRIIILSLITFFICCGYDRSLIGYPTVYAQREAQSRKLTEDQSFPKHIDYFLKTISKASQKECLEIFGPYGEIISKELNVDNLYFTSYQDVEQLLKQAVHESIDSLTLFTHPLLQNQKRYAIVFSESLLQEIDQHFNFHGLFNISTPSLDAGPPIKMTFIVMGQGKFIVGYNRNTTIKHPDYAFATGKYKYNELFIMDAKKDSAGNVGLLNIKGLSSPNAKPAWMKGPVNVDIRSMVMTTNPDNRRQILIQYSLFGRKHKLIDPIPIEKLDP
jgi:hypothetical protein